MRNNGILVKSAISGLILLGAAGAASTAAAATPEVEKCFGIVKAGKNDCQTKTSACAGTSKQDGQKDAWIYVPKGSCDKIVGGSSKSS